MGGGSFLVSSSATTQATITNAMMRAMTPTTYRCLTCGSLANPLIWRSRYHSGIRTALILPPTWATITLS